MTNFSYEFGRAVAHFQGQTFDMQTFIQFCQGIGLTYACGANGLRDAMLGAFDEYKRVADLNDSCKTKSE